MFSGSQAVANDTRTKPLTQVEEKFSVLDKKKPASATTTKTETGFLKRTPAVWLTHRRANNQRCPLVWRGPHARGQDKHGTAYSNHQKGTNEL
jgi:hypothetical protein